MAEAARIEDSSDTGLDTGNRRRAQRQRVILGGKLVHSGTAYTLNVLLKNMTAFGARLVLPNGATTPDRFDLIDMKNGDAFECRLVWREYPHVGVVFESRARLETADTPRLTALKSLWLSSLVR